MSGIQLLADGAIPLVLLFPEVAFDEAKFLATVDAKVKAFWRDNWGRWDARVPFEGARKYHRILKSLREHRIEIPYPQRVVHMQPSH